MYNLPWKKHEFVPKIPWNPSLGLYGAQGGARNSTIIVINTQSAAPPYEPRVRMSRNFDESNDCKLETLVKCSIPKSFNFTELCIYYLILEYSKHITY